MRQISRLCTLALFSLGVLTWGGGATPLLAQTVTVTSAFPSAAGLGTVNLNVIVSGNGFKSGAQAVWFLSGTTNPAGVTVNSTAFNGASQVTANITVAAGATLGSFDVLVRNPNGRTGKGTGIFAVTQTSPSCGVPITSVLNDTDGSKPYQLQSDGL